MKDLDSQLQNSAILTLATIWIEVDNCKLNFFSQKCSENEFAFYFSLSNYFFRTTQDPMMNDNMPTTYLLVSDDQSAVGVGINMCAVWHEAAGV